MKRFAAIFPLLLAFVLLVGILAACSSNQFTGDRAAAPDSYTLRIQRMTGTDSHTMTLTAGDSLGIRFETEDGTLRLTIAAPDGAVLYTGTGREATDFTVSVPQNGVYTVTVSALRAKGFIQIQARGRGE